MRSDEDLLDSWRSGDRDAGDALIARHFESLHRFFDSKLGDGAEDLVQRTLLDCVEARDAVREGNFRAYLFGVARHRLIDHLRTRLRRGDVIDLDAISIADLGTSPGDRLVRGEDEARVRRALQMISIDHQIALELAYWEGLSGREIAQVLGIDANTVRSRLARARDALRQRLVELGASPDAVERTLSQMPEGD